MRYIKELFLLNLYDYEHIKFRMPIGMILTFLAIALAAATFFITYRKRYTYTFFTQLIRHNADCEERAKTLKELRLADYGALKRALSRSGQLTYMIKRVDEVKPTYEEARKRGFKYAKIDFTTERFYINPESLAKVKQIENTSYPAWWKPVVASIAILVVFAVLLICMPKLLELIDYWIA